jgi:hypothetical protein
MRRVRRPDVVVIESAWDPAAADRRNPGPPGAIGGTICPSAGAQGVTRMGDKGPGSKGGGKKPKGGPKPVVKKP